ncbi:isopentenyl-diphosphate Delta-isomerase [Microbacterium amylolyticum]|uniref:Isopentenyl-diphosphate Delta-isomerase n=1 Tax=Microbacterium amylolyticum TaxID=936337 RepID=A0ABS4ZF16_9MICO|nr:isopentenyl-diphosphate Delta-isomerase [Microbacterium amylolyticum]MBP2435875.1 isopentenyl-diphosphate delta-isomerase [Microbacterium amylolyticum]
MTATRERVVLLDDQGAALGVADKRDVHTTSTPLHLAFSCHLLDDDGRVLITRRAMTKRTWPGTWTNSFCGHPEPFEAVPDAVERRAQQELGTFVDAITLALPDFRYRAVDASGIVENEICPVYLARHAGDIVPSADEVMETRWVKPEDLAAALTAAPWAFSPWLVLQAQDLSGADGVIRASAWQRERTAT